MSVDVGWQALRRAYAAHKDANEHLPSGPSAYLLLFYCVECGFKAALLHRQGLRGTNQLEASERGHDLRQLGKALRLSEQLMAGLRGCKNRSNGNVVAVHELHEAWRYGVALVADGENDVVAGLNKLSKWCRDELKR
jgi:hypothetical protein